MERFFNNISYHGLVVDALMIVTSSAMLAMMFPGVSWPALAWVALVPLLLQIFRSGYTEAILSAFLVGFLFFISLMGWTIRLEELDLFRFCVLGFYLAAFFGLFGALAKYFHNRLPAWDALTFPSIWVSIEYLKSNIGFLSFPPGILGYSQYQVLPVAGIASFTGVYGVSFAIVAVNGALASIVWCFITHHKSRGAESTELIRSLFIPCCSILLFISVFFVRNIPTSQPALTTRAINIALVQGNAVVTDKHGYEQYMRNVFPIYEKLTLQSTATGPSLVVWPSASVPGVIPIDRKMVGLVSEIARKNGVHLLIGAAGLDKFNAEQVRARRVANSAFLFSPTGAIIGRYDKIHLLPFDEYLPARDYISWPSWIVAPGMTDHYPGKKLTVFQAGQTRFGVQICYENMFPDQFRQLVANGADFVVGQTNELWTKSEAAQYQNLAYYVFRAIENGVPVVRSSTNGVSCIIDANGRIVSSVKNHDGREVNVAGFSTAKVNIGAEKSFYNHFGDLLIWACLSFILMMGLYGFFRKVHEPVHA